MRTDRDTANPAADAMIGRTLEGRYVIGQRIARGGMASVYEAHDERLDRTVAVKVMHPGLGDDEAFAARFVREARAAAKLSHPNVVAVYDQGDDNGVVFLAMELVRGHTLRDTVTRDSPIPPAKALSLVEPVLSALAAAHRAGLVHRDVKPENVLIAEAGGQVKVADFGLARAVSTETNHTSSGVLIGTVSYIAPELVVEGKADARADVYSVGVMLYELLTGEKPHAGETPIQVAYKHVHDDVPPPSRRAPGIPPYVDALVARATARDRDLRPSDAGVLLHQLRRVRSALLEGLADDPDLTSDLALPVLGYREDTVEEAVAVGGDTSHRHGVQSYRGDDETTRQLRRPPVAASSTTATTPVAAAPARPRRPGRVRRVFTSLLVLLVLAGLGAGGWWMLEGRYTHTPSLVGLDRAQAAERLDAVGLDIDVRRAFSDTVPKGEVISSDPARDGKVLDGGTVEVTVSKGVEEYPVPKLARTPVQEATDKLEDLKMKVRGPVEQWSETIPDGSVIRTDPKPGTVLRPGTEVTLYVSKGRQPIKVSSWEGKQAKQAAASLKKKGLKVKVDRQYSDTAPAGVVISQSPESGTLHKKDTVTLLVSRGPELVAVPNVGGHGIEEAKQTLESAGFQVDVQDYAIHFGLGYVMSQDPASGKLPKGSTVTLWVN